jgi:hypothetical protein
MPIIRQLPRPYRASSSDLREEVLGDQEVRGDREDWRFGRIRRHDHLCAERDRRCAVPSVPVSILRGSSAV